MLSRALILAAVAFVLGCFGAIPADAQNLEAGKAPSQIFSSTCSLCHKSSRGLLKTVAPGSLPGFLRQHYTTSTDMAGAMSAYVLSNGAANAAPGGNLTKQGQDAKSGRPSQEPGPDQAAKGNKPTREASRPDADGLQNGTTDAAAQTVSQKAAAERRAQRKAAREAARSAKSGVPPKSEARHEPAKDEPTVDSAKTDASTTEPAKDSTKSESAKVEGSRPDPVPAVTPAPKSSENPAEVAAAPAPVIDDPNRPLTIDITPATPSVMVPVGPPSVPATTPQPPISR
jgi:hypothetical protein